MRAILKRPLILCVVSAAIGALASAYWTKHELLRPSFAQEIVRPGPPDARMRLPQTPPPIDDSLTPEERVNVSVYERVNRSVVNINTKTVRNDNLFLIEVPSEGAGSGSVIDTRGHILTNNHVIDGARNIQVTLYDGKSYEARLVGKDETNDVAVIVIDAPAASLIPVTFGDSTHLKVGQKVFAIGNPFGLERTLTTGIVSSLNRTLPARGHREIKSVIQIDAAINPGNSGGPLLDSRSRLIGMNTAIASSTGQSAGVGFAVPIANILRVVPQLIEHGRVIRPDSGISRVLQTENGLLIATMTPAGPAEQAGLRGFRLVRQTKKKGFISYETQTIDRNAADLIVAVDGEKIKTAGDFLALIEAKRPGDEAVITVVREGREVNVPIRLTVAE